MYDNPLRRLQAAISPLGRQRRTTVEVLRDVDFHITRGESVAIIGPNGAGKSTILHLVAGLLEPSAGTVRVEGSVSSLLELGGSFLPELTGRENARFFRDVVSGDRGDYDAWERAVERFAEIGQFFDRPVRTYSDGMFLRLAFACAAAEEPDVLLLDEVLAVGDARFQQKCFRRLRQLRERGTTIVVVSHLVHMLAALCDRALVLDHGELVFDGPAGAGIARYYQLFFMAPDHPAPDRAEDEVRYGDGSARIESPAAAHADPTRAGPFGAGDRLAITFEVQFRRTVAEPQIGFSCTTTEGLCVYATSSAMLDGLLAPAADGERRRVEVRFDVPVAVGDLFVDLSVFEIIDSQVSVLDARIGVLHVAVKPPGHYVGIADLAASIRSDAPLALPEMRL
jgi:lipopolysaccharide transport system ATP-binding protein